MSVDEKALESFAALFHHYHSALAPDFGCSAESEVEWKELTSNERKCAVAAARLAVIEMQSEPTGKVPNIFTSWPLNGTEGRDCGC